MYISTGLLDYMPLAQMPFNKTKPVETTTKQDIVEVTKTAIDKKADKYKHEIIYAYHPHNNNKLHTNQGRNVDFIVA